MKSIFKVLPFVITCALLLGISGASGSCSYVGVTTGSSYDVNYLQRIYNSSASKTWSGTLHAVVDNTTTSGISCLVGLTISITSGNLTNANSAWFPLSGSISVLVYDATTVNNTNMALLPIISTNVLNKSYYYAVAGVGEIADSWDNTGVWNWMFYRESSGGTSFLVSITRVSPVTPGYESWSILLAGCIGIASIIGVIVKKRW
jgi:hypothetical protein